MMYKELKNVVFFILTVTVMFQNGKGCSNIYFECNDGKCIDIDYECDDDMDCSEGEDELNCEATACLPLEYTCNNGLCISSRGKCDGFKDCAGGEDELNCEGKTCQLTEFQCNDRKCISSRYRCDGQAHCSGAEDEIGCIGNICLLTEFQCNDGKCISSRYKCDGQAQCSGSEDELGCIGCLPTQMKCTNESNCAVKCDGYIQCIGGEDEKDCKGIDCQFPCYSGICVDFGSVCDGKRDCAGGEDELVCREIIPVLEVKNKNYTAKVGDRVTLECKVSNVSLNYSVFWEKNDKKLTAGTIGTQGITREFPSLTITSVTTADAGVYTCNAATVVGTGKSEPVTLKVLGGIPEVSVSSTNYSVFVGDEVILQCIIKASPIVEVVYWQKETNLSTSTYNAGSVGTEGIIPSNPSLKIMAATFNDAGLYTCFGVNNVGTGQSRKVSLDVIGAKPEVNVQLTYYEVIYGSLIKLGCTVKAKPAVSEVYWTRNTSDEIIKISAGNPGTGGISIGDPSLIITAARTTDSGLYKCHALNSVGIGISQGVNLTVRGGLPTVTVQSESYTTDYNKTITLQCFVVSNPPANLVYWTKSTSGQLTTINRGAVGIEGLTTNQPSLTIVSPSAADSGQYACHASNEVGTSNSRYTSLTVNGKDGNQNGSTTNAPGSPLVKITSNNYTVMFSAPITLECRVTGVNINRIFWKRTVNNQYKVLEYGTPGTTGISVASPSLTIKNASKADGGVYTCHAINFNGTGQSDNVTLNVIGDLPEVMVETTTYGGTFGETKTLECSIKAVPAVTHVYWQKTSSGITTTFNAGAIGIRGVNVSYPSLVILSVSDTYDGEYTCYATNNIGTGESKSVLLRVLGSEPEVIVASNSYEVDYGKSIKLQCIIRAKPTVSQVYWTKYSQGVTTEIIAGTVGTGGISIDDPSLIINSARTTDSGNYTCKGKNSVGEGTSQTVSLKVKGGLPIVKIEKDSYTATAGIGIALRCKIDAIPKVAKIYWQKESMGQITFINQGGVGIEGLSTDHPSLTLPSPSSADVGQYSCHATNDVGTSSSQQAFLQVISPETSGGSDGTAVDKTGQWVNIVGGVIGALAALASIIGTFIACRSCK